MHFLFVVINRIFITNFGRFVFLNLVLNPVVSKNIFLFRKMHFIQKMHFSKELKQTKQSDL